MKLSLWFNRLLLCFATLTLIITTSAILLPQFSAAADSIVVTRPPIDDLLKSDLTISERGTQITPSEVERGGTINISSLTVNNQGAAASGSFSVGIYLSTDRQITADDLLLDTYTNRAGVESEESFEWTKKTLVMPLDIIEGSYYIGFFADNADAVSEFDETNNIMAVQISITSPVVIIDRLPDLTFNKSTNLPSFTPPAINSGGSITVSGASVLNQGEALSGSFSCDVYLSNDETITESDTRLGGFDFKDGVGAAQSVQFSESTFTTPPNLAHGDYFVAIVIDRADAVKESNEQNNSFVLASKLIIMDNSQVQVKPVMDSPFEEIGGKIVPVDQPAAEINPIPLPRGQKSWTVFPSAVPAVNEDPSAAAVFGLGTVAHGGGNLSLKVMLGKFSGQVDLYLAIYHQIGDSPGTFFMVSENGSLEIFDGTELIAWKKGTAGPVSEDILGDIPAKNLPSGDYMLFLVASPAGKGISDNYYLWSSSFKTYNKWLPSELDIYYPNWKDMVIDNNLPEIIGDIILNQDLTILSTNPVQVIDGAPLVQGKGTIFRVTVKSSFLTQVSAYFRLSLGTIPNKMWNTKENFPEIWGPVVIQPGESEIVLPYIPAGRENNFYSAQTDPAGIIEGEYFFGTHHPTKRSLPAPIANYCSYTVTIDPENKIKEGNENNNSKYHSTSAAGVKSWRILFVPVHQKPNNPPRLNRVYSVARKSVEYLMATYPIPDNGITWSVAAPTTTVPCPDNASYNCGYATIWEEGVGRGTFFSQLLQKSFKNDYSQYDPYSQSISTDDFDFVVAVTSGGGGGAGGSDKVVAIGDEAYDTIMTHEFTHSVIGVYDIYSADCLVGWDEAYCEHSDGSREYCCIDGLDANHPQDYFCYLNAAGTIECDYSSLVTKNCSESCNNYQSCRNDCSSICSDGTVYSGPDGRVRHPSSKGFWTVKWIEINDRFNYFMDARIEAGTPYPYMWNILGNSIYHCYWGFGPINHQDGYLNILNHTRFKKP
ncbi:MAG: hypothetical protein HQK70_06960 [Desulfamplus sp.]|nr:hypothetical protein [Desulfamplus sp.]